LRGDAPADAVRAGVLLGARGFDGGLSQRAAAILHDQRKAGKGGEETQSDHDLRMGDVVRQKSDLGEAVARAIEEHMGPWYDGPEPSSTLAELVHVADMMASDEHVDIALPGPVPEELEEYGYDAAAGLD